MTEVEAFARCTVRVPNVNTGSLIVSSVVRIPWTQLVGTPDSATEHTNTHA